MSIMTKPQNKQYDEGWDRIWGKKKRAPKAKEKTPGNSGASSGNGRKKG